MWWRMKSNRCDKIVIPEIFEPYELVALVNSDFRLTRWLDRATSEKRSCLLPRRQNEMEFSWWRCGRDKLAASRRRRPNNRARRIGNPSEGPGILIIILNWTVDHFNNWENPLIRCSNAGTFPSFYLHYESCANWIMHLG